MPKTLSDVSREIMLRNAHAQLCKQYARYSLWAFVRDICGVGSTSAAAICRELGWEPDADAGKPLPSWHSQKTQTPAAP